MTNERNDGSHDREDASRRSPDGVDATIAAYFEMLLNDAPAVEYERPVIETRSAGATDAELAAVDDAKVAALKVRALLHDYRRRESELAALYETANDLAGMRNLDQVLRAIVDRARALLGTDIAYLTLREAHSEDTTMRVTSGSVSAQFQQVRLGPGEGLGGLVAATARPYVTANYFTDDRFAHTELIDSAVREEGLVAILGVPLELNGQVIGVLFAANRRERPFAQAEIALLRSLATHAAIAIDSANLIDRTRTALDELNAVNAQLRARTDEVERAADAHDKLTDLLLRGADTEDITAAVAALLGGTVKLVDPADGTRNDDDTLAQAITESLAKARVVRSGTSHDTWVAAAAAGSEPLVALILHRPSELGAAEQRILERAAVVAALLLLRRRSVSDAEHRVRGELLDEVLDTPRGDPESLRQRARRVATDPEQPYVIVVADAADADPERLDAAARHIAEVRRGLAGRRDGRTVLALPAESPKEWVATVAADLRTAIGTQLTAAASGPTNGLASFPRVHREAVRCLKALHALGRSGTAAVPADLGFLGVLLGDNHDAGSFVAGTLGPLVDYDAERGTALVETLAAYFASGGSLIRAKDALHVHVNTVSQRLDRISQLIGADWNEPERALELQLALRVNGLLRHGVDLGDDLPDG
ncbi:GAF domain-containing protein [Phytoactinopolyspora mesophila]|uniref:GAF domain-containing protein n=1 Tax=Phytoactinopolyspora mesophila TaxID=2650750 RepID=A0A7K3M2A8_9ACTN|nr:GAF domain-containing protein [Phytoactinopolyspora mesophila]NDL57167.1 GAF domain-containing protein [Phytoactinopolyspora mesophila]